MPFLTHPEPSPSLPSPPATLKYSATLFEHSASQFSLHFPLSPFLTIAAAVWAIYWSPHPSFEHTFPELNHKLAKGNCLTAASQGTCRPQRLWHLTHFSRKILSSLRIGENSCPVTVWTIRHASQVLYPVVHKIKEVLLFVKVLLKSSGCTGPQCQHFSLLPSPHPRPYWTRWIGNFFSCVLSVSVVFDSASPQAPIRLFCGIFQARMLE